MQRFLLVTAAVGSLGFGAFAVLAPGERPPVRPSLDEAVEEWRSACDHLAGDALQACLRDDTHESR